MARDRKMTVVTRRIEATPKVVFEQLSDPWLYAAWVVGAAHIRGVDGQWPEKGAKLLHRVGPWPVSIDDETEILEAVPDSRLILAARGWPLGEARVELELRAVGDGATEVSMAEAPVSGPGGALDNPLVRAWLRARNKESLSRLADIAEKRPTIMTTARPLDQG